MGGVILRKASCTWLIDGFGRNAHCNGTRTPLPSRMDLHADQSSCTFTVCRQRKCKREKRNLACNTNQDVALFLLPSEKQWMKLQLDSSRGFSSQNFLFLRLSLFFFLYKGRRLTGKSVCLSVNQLHAVGLKPALLCYCTWSLWHYPMWISVLSSCVWIY